MTKKNITIAISGEVATGKSRITHLIKEALAEKGIDVDFVNDRDFPTEEAFDIAMSKDYDEAIENISRKTKVTLVQVQVQRPLIQQE
jgi:uridine kinase